MLLEIDNLGTNWVPISYRCELSEPEVTDQISLDGPVELSGEARRRNTQIELRGTLQAAGTIECGRCLEPVRVELSAPFETVFTPDEDEASHEVELSGDDLSAARLTGDVIDLAELAREQVLLNLPVRVICSEECRGLCAICGANKNLRPCECEKETIDPRWQALRELKNSES